MNKSHSAICLEVQELEKSYGGHPVVKGLSFFVNQGEIVALLGPNGAGKTTAFYMTIGLIRPDKGKVYFNSQDITNLPIHKRAQMGMGYLAQEPSVFRYLSVEENILCILESLPLAKADKKIRLEELLGELHLTHLAKKKAISLSGGERRRLEITRALVTHPNFLLLDEPFANIDPISVEEVKQLVKMLSKKNISILITDHNAREVFSIADRTYLMCEGKALKNGAVDELIHDEEVRRTYLGESFRL